jgi:HD-like signal output (HDOD) protein
MSISGHGNNASLAHLSLRYPALPQTFLRVVELVQSGASSDPETVCEAIQHDPGVVARVLRIANSAQQSSEDEVRSVRRAVDILGAESIVGVVLGMNMAEIRSSIDGATTLPLLNYVRHSVAVAFLSRYIYLLDPLAPKGAAARQDRSNEAFTAGLLHDFGKLVLLHNFPDAASRFYGLMVGDFTSDYAVLEAERILFGFNHAEAGNFISRQLHFPSLFTQVMALHHAAADLSAFPESLRHLIYVVAAANRVAHALDSNRPDEALEGVMGDGVWALLMADGRLGPGGVPAILEALCDAKESLEEYLEAFA